MYFLQTLPAILISALLVIPSLAGVGDEWENPEAPDFTTTLTQGEVFVIKWTSDLEQWFGDFCSDCNPTNVELWITGTDSSNPQQIASGINVSSTLAVQWTVEIAAPTLVTTWVFRFISSLSSFQLTGQQISSPEFNLSVPSSASTTTSRPSTTSPSLSTATSSNSPASTMTTSATATGSPTIITIPSSVAAKLSKLSPGAAAAIGAGVVAVIAIVLGILSWCLVRRSRRRTGARAARGGFPGSSAEQLHNGSGVLLGPIIRQDDRLQNESNPSRGTVGFDSPAGPMIETPIRDAIRRVPVGQADRRLVDMRVEEEAKAEMARQAPAIKEPEKQKRKNKQPKNHRHSEIERETHQMLEDLEHVSRHEDGPA